MHFDADHLSERLELSQRLAEVCALLVRGDTVHGVSYELELSPGTVKTYIGRLYEKLEVDNRVSLVRVVLDRAGDDPPGDDPPNG